MAYEPANKSFDTVIVGNGPSALILSYILHGNIPYYNPSTPHPDPILHAKLQISPCLLNVDIRDFTAHFGASRLSYSTQALPVNVLLDTLIRPLADTEPGAHASRVTWKSEPERAVDHVVLGNTGQAGGQWADNPVEASWDIGALSYAEMLSLPAYTFQDHFARLAKAFSAEFHRPTRREVADYFAAYPKAVGIEGSFRYSTDVSDVARTSRGFFIGSHGIYCKHLVLASGTFTHLLPARLQLEPLFHLDQPCEDSKAALLVVGSGFTAADTIITNLSTYPDQKIIHIFKWDPEERPSPLKACHPRAYPEYAGIYRRMKLAALNAANTDKSVMSPLKKSKANPFFDSSTWQQTYEGFPNTRIAEVLLPDDGRNDCAVVVLEDSSGQRCERLVSGLKYHIGRRGSLDYLTKSLQEEICTRDQLPRPNCNLTSLAGPSLRSKAEKSLEVAPDVFITGSLTGDSLVRFSLGGCVFAAREIMRRRVATADGILRPSAGLGTLVEVSSEGTEASHDDRRVDEETRDESNARGDDDKDYDHDVHDNDPQVSQAQHLDLHIDRRETLLTRMDSKGRRLRRPSWWTPSSCMLT